MVIIERRGEGGGVLRRRHPDVRQAGMALAYELETAGADASLITAANALKPADLPHEVSAGTATWRVEWTAEVEGGADVPLSGDDVPAAPDR
jgi:hypothetical protein